ncbi:translation initiation factor IF-2 [Neisseria bacilliformis ATCC BAA-1200]|uniref:Translation initiation factor IF-2 n=1 Tax=Neisseria bacilliformis ATCC BAA-1200 TaxID=888742 RepID=F2BG65_9NEIS|nr:translation initiation factor IF-2 [Neisseria bacilliformis ATCC BAA-1200]
MKPVSEGRLKTHPCRPTKSEFPAKPKPCAWLAPHPLPQRQRPSETFRRPLPVSAIIRAAHGSDRQSPRIA